MLDSSVAQLVERRACCTCKS